MWQKGYFNQELLDLKSRKPNEPLDGISTENLQKLVEKYASFFVRKKTSETPSSRVEKIIITQENRKEYKNRKKKKEKKLLLLLMGF